MFGKKREEMSVWLQGEFPYSRKVEEGENKN